MLVNHRNLYYQHKVFKVAHESRDCTQSTWIIFSVLFYFNRGRKRKERNYLWQWIIKIIIITRPHKLCTKRETKVGTVLCKRKRGSRLSVNL